MSESIVPNIKLEPAIAQVDCIRSGLVKPSFVMPFIEPALPYYDSIRNQPEFEELRVQISKSENT